jgi:hypothetical protein
MNNTVKYALTAYAASSALIGTTIAVKVACSKEANFKINDATYKANFFNSFLFGTLFGAVAIPLVPVSFAYNLVRGE